MKTLDGLMAFLAKRLTEEEHQALARQAAAEGLGLRDYVGRYVLKMAERKFAGRQVPAAPPARQPSVIIDAVYAATVAREVD
jgi:hypothetical protein